MRAFDAVDRIDDLFRQAIEQSDDVSEPMLAGWLEDGVEMVGHDREQAKALRRAVRTARKLAGYWLEHDPGALPHWRNGVDEALGGRGWQSQLDLLRAALESTPDPEVFEAVRERHRAVHFTEWMEAVTYEEWLASR
ncbi:MAG: hypothetical protein V3V29_10320 [Acidimicrobiia bacterium]